MLTIILLSILLTGSVILLILSIKKGDTDLITAAISLLVIILLISTAPIVNLCTIKRDANQITYEYNYTKQILETGTKYQNSYGNNPDLTVEVLSINHQIARYKANHENLWLNVWFPKRVGELEPLTLP